MGSIIVLETFLGLLDADPTSYLWVDGWRPHPEIAGSSDPEAFGVPQLIRWVLTGRNA